MSLLRTLDEVIAHKHEEVRRKRAEQPLGALQTAIRSRPAAQSLAAVLARPGVALIAEIKRRSPAKQRYGADLSPGQLAPVYVSNGAAAISVLADERFFGGGAKTIEEVVAAVAGAVPVIYKDFIVDPYQVAEARALGGDAVLIVVRATDPVVLRESVSHAYALGMDCVVEVFTAEDAERALAAGARIIGINNRDLATFEIDIERSTRMRKALPPDILSISESGLNSPDDVRRAGLLGFHAVLIGEAILAASDVAAKVRELSSAGAAIPNLVSQEEREGRGLS